MEFGDVLEKIEETDTRRVKLKCTLVSLPVHDTCKHSEHRMAGSLFFVPTNFDTKSLGVHQCCGSGMFIRIPDPAFYPSRIPDVGSRIQKQLQKRGVKKNCCYTFFYSHKFNKIVNYLMFEMPNKKIWANFQRIIELFTQKFVAKLSKIWVWDPGSEIRDPGAKKAPDPGSGSATLAFIRSLESSCSS